MKMTKKKGFTVVELVIVIAVIAVLAAVLIPTFVTLVNRANNSADTQMVANLNKYLAAMEALDGKNKTMADAMADAADAGYTAGAFTSATNTILWDSTSDRFLAVNDKGTVIAHADGTKYEKDAAGTYSNYWAVSLTYDSEAEYSYYLLSNAVIPNVLFNVKCGLDISSLTFDKVEDMPAITYNGNGTNIVFNGEFSSVTINCAEGDVKLFGFVSELTLTEGNLEVSGFVANLNETVLPNNEGGSAQGSLTATNAKFRQSQTKIGEIMTFKTFTDNGSKYGQHYFGAHNDLEKCLCCSDAAVNPNHVCVTGAATTEDRDDGTYLVIKCTICGKELFAPKLKTDCRGEHTMEDELKKEPTCTEPGYVIKWCVKCENYREITEIPALGHREVEGEGKAATCTETGLTNGKYCTRCSTEGKTVWTEPQVEIPALGHDYDRTTGKCKHCNADQPTVTINADVLHSSQITREDFGSYTTISFNGYEPLMDKVIFGYKEDYIHSINASRVEFENGKIYDGVEVYAVYKKNPNYQKSYNEEGWPTDRGQETGDNREFLVDYYVLSDKRMCYTNEGASYSFACGLGIGVMYYYKNTAGHFQHTYHLAGAVKEIRFENFDTSKTTSFDNMFSLCQVQKLDLSGLTIDSVTSFNGIFYGSNFKEVIYPKNWPEGEDYQADLVTEGWE